MRTFKITEEQFKHISAVVAEMPVKYGYSLIALLIAIEKAEIKESTSDNK